MSRSLSPVEVRRLRLFAQRLHPETAGATTGVAPLVKHLLGIQAQEWPAATLAVRARSRDLLAEDVQRAREDAHAVVVTWAMRGTLHLVAEADLGWLLAYFGPLGLDKDQRRFRQLGLDAATRARATALMRVILRERGPLTRPALAEILAGEGIPVAGQAIAHLVSGAALEGAICLGPMQGHKPTYVALDGWVSLGDALDPDQVPVELAHRYLTGHAPATPDDLAKWAGISIGVARTGFEALENELVPVETEEGPAWLLKSQAAWLDAAPDAPVVRLLPGYDPYLLGYQRRDFMVSAGDARRIHPGGGVIRPTLIVDGRAAGIWKLTRRTKRSALIVTPFAPLDPAILPGLEAEVEDMGRFLGQAIELVVD